MKRLIGALILGLLIIASVSGEANRKTQFSGSQSGTWANDVDSISFSLTGSNRMFFANSSADRDATWDRLVGIFDINNHVAVKARDSLGKRDTVIVTLKALGQNGLRIDTLQTDTLVIIRDRSEIKYNLTNFVESITTTHFALDSAGILMTDSAATVNTTSSVVTTNRFFLELNQLTFDIHMIDSVMTTNDTVTFQAQWFMEFIDEK